MTDNLMKLPTKKVHFDDEEEDTMTEYFGGNSEDGESSGGHSDDKSWWRTIKQVGVTAFILAIVTNPYYNIDDLLKAITYFDENPLMAFAVKITIIILILIFADRYT